MAVKAPMSLESTTWPTARSLPVCTMVGAGIVDDSARVWESEASFQKPAGESHMHNKVRSLGGADTSGGRQGAMGEAGGISDRTAAGATGMSACSMSRSRSRSPSAASSVAAALTGARSLRPPISERSSAAVSITICSVMPVRSWR